MKMKKLLLTVLISFTIGQLFAQLTDARKAELKKIHSEAPIVIKGRLVDQAYEKGFTEPYGERKKIMLNGNEVEISSYDPYKPYDRDEDHHAKIIEVMEIYKGHDLISIGEALIMADANTLGGGFSYGEDVIFLSPDNQNKKEFDSTELRGKAISPSIQRFSIVQVLKRRELEGIESWYGVKGQKFENSKQLDSYLNSVDGVSTKSKVSNLVPTQSIVSEEELEASREKALQRNREIYEQGQERLKLKEAQKKSANQRTLQTTSSVDLTITFDNPKNIALNGNAQDRWMQFDVMSSDGARSLI